MYGTMYVYNVRVQCTCTMYVYNVRMQCTCTVYFYSVQKRSFCMQNLAHLAHQLELSRSNLVHQLSFLNLKFSTISTLTFPNCFFFCFYISPKRTKKLLLFYRRGNPLMFDDDETYFNIARM